MLNLERIRSKIVPAGTLSRMASGWRSAGKQLVFTNGCFDVLHRGHIEYLSKASDMGDILVIGLNSDGSVQRLKGKGRPLLDETTRSLILASLFFVDYVTLFSEDTPERLIAELIPDILVKGGDYRAEDIAGYGTVTGHGGRVLTIPLTPGQSSTGLIGRIKSLDP